MFYVWRKRRARQSKTRAGINFDDATTDKRQAELGGISAHVPAAETRSRSLYPDDKSIDGMCPRSALASENRIAVRIRF